MSLEVILWSTNTKLIWGMQLLETQFLLFCFYVDSKIMYNFESDLDHSCYFGFCCNCPLFNIDCGVWMDARQIETRLKYPLLCRKCTTQELYWIQIYTLALCYFIDCTMPASAVSFSHTFEIDRGHYLGDLLLERLFFSPPLVTGGARDSSL